MALASSPPLEHDTYGPPADSEWRSIDWREYLNWALVGGNPINYVDIGSGPPLLLVHGLSGSWQNWLETIPYFARTHRVLALDLPGFGESPMPREQISIKGYGRTLDEFCDAVGVDRAVVVGNSMGGFVAAELAIRHPKRVAKLVLVAAAGITIEHQRNERALSLMRRFEFALTWAATHPKPELMMRRRARRAMRFVFAHPQEIPGALLVEQAKGGGKPGFIDALDALTSYPLRDRLSEISVPTLIVWGDSDRLVPTSDADVFEELIPDTRKFVYEDTGHVPQIERPERFNRDLEAFLAE